MQVRGEGEGEGERERRKESRHGTPKFEVPEELQLLTGLRGRPLDVDVEVVVAEVVDVV